MRSNPISIVDRFPAAAARGRRCAEQDSRTARAFVVPAPRRCPRSRTIHRWRAVLNVLALASVVTAGLTPLGGHAALAQTAPQVTASVNATPGSVSPGQSIQLTVSVNSSTTIAALVDVEVLNPAGHLAFQRFWDNETLQANAGRSYTTLWTVGGSAPAGTYTVKAGVVAPNWGALYTWNDRAASVSVAAAATATASPTKTAPPTATPAPTQTSQPGVHAGASVSSSSVTPGNSVPINAWVTSDSSITAQMDVEVFGPAGQRVFQQFWDYQSLTAGVSRSYQAWWLVDAAAPSGAYTVKVGVTAPKWGSLYTWNDQAAVISVTGAPAAPAVTSWPTAVAWPTATSAPPTATPSAPPTQPASATSSSSPPRLVFGLGSEAPAALSSALSQNAPVRMLSNWFNKSDDLTWMAGWKTGQIPQAYAAGYAMHLIVYAPDDTPNTSPRQFWTKYGLACGRPYPLSDRFLDDMRQLAQIFAGQPGGPPLYVTLFTEFQTYGCGGGAWNPDPETNAYYRALKDRYLEALAVFHQNAPNAKVSLGWGGWQARYDDPATGAGRSMFQYFADALWASDFQSFQAMQLDTNVDDVLAMTRTLGQYGPVLLAHYRPDRYWPDWASQAVFDADMRAMLNDTFLSQATAAGLFGWSFMDDVYLRNSASDYNFVRDAVQRYGVSTYATTRLAP